tara:strand:- start:854 stop:1231 length:378 start_codon:yes stop_codon:yes gene_type:complete
MVVVTVEMVEVVMDQTVLVEEVLVDILETVDWVEHKIIIVVMDGMDQVELVVEDLMVCTMDLLDLVVMVVELVFLVKVLVELEELVMFRAMDRMVIQDQVVMDNHMVEEDMDQTKIIQVQVDLVL